MNQSGELLLDALEIQQGPGRTLYSFAVDGKKIPSFATVSRIRRQGSEEIFGYQRPEVLSHIEEIRRYVESEVPMIPNALVIAFDSRVKFEPNDGGHQAHNPGVRYGKLRIPTELALEDSQKPGWIVDGQQRVAAVRNARVDSFPLCVTAFISDSMEEQRSQFILVNSTKPLPKGLIYELLPTTEGLLPTQLQKKQFPAMLLERLNHDEASPFYKMIRTPTNGDGVIKDNSILKMLENSLYEGALYPYRDPVSGRGDMDKMLGILHAFWGAVKAVFEDAWGLPPKRSRLMHGAGIVSLGFIMDDIVVLLKDGMGKAQFVEKLEPLKESCYWTEGSWPFGPGHHRKWNELQNTSKDIQLLANYLRIEFRNRISQRRRFAL